MQEEISLKFSQAAGNPKAFLVSSGSKKCFCLFVLFS